MTPDRCSHCGQPLPAELSAKESEQAKVLPSSAPSASPPSASGSLPESSGFYRILFDEDPVGLALCRLDDGSYVAVNKAFAAILGLSQEETLKSSYWDITPREDYEEQEAAQLAKIHREGRYGPYYKEYWRGGKKEDRVAVRLRGHRVHYEGTDYIWSLVENLDNERYWILFQEAGVGLVLTTLDGAMIVDVNKKFVEYVGWSEKELRSMNLRDLTPAGFESEDAKQVAELMEYGRYGPYSKEFKHKDGRLIPVTLTGLKVPIGGVNFIWSIVERGMIVGGDI
jgi:PAS domain S-box-containing protein